MTHFEFWTNLATVILLVPAIILSFRLSRQLGKLNQNQERMIELAAALRRAAETYGADNGRRVADSTGLSAASPTAGFASPAPAAEEQPAAAAKEPHFDRDESNEAPSEAELELLQALRSIK